MATKNAAHDPARGPHQEESENQPPHGHISHGVGRFLSQIDPDTLGDDWIEELGARYQRWKDDSEQADLEEFADD